MDLIECVAYRIYSKRVRTHVDKYSKLQTKIRQAHIPKPVEQYVSNAYLYSILAGLAAGIMGLWLSTNVFDSITNIPAITFGTGALSEWTEANITGLLGVAAGLLLFIIIQQAVYFIYTLIPSFKASILQSGIDQSLPHTVIYLYALSRGGMDILDIFRSLNTYSHIYGTAAKEFGYIVRDIEYFGQDMLTALRSASIRTPSEKLKEFLDGLVSVITSGGDITAYLKSKSEQYQFVAVREQKIFLETLGVLAEVYISIFVVGPLFLIIILVILGLIGSGATNILYLLVYVIIPISTMMYLLFLVTLSGTNVKVPKTYIIEKKLTVFEAVPIKATLGVNSKNELKRIKQVRFYEYISRICEIILHPLIAMRNNAKYSFAISIPLGLLYFAYTISTKGFEITINKFDLTRINVGQLASLDDQIIISILIAVIPFIIFYEMHARRVKHIEDMMPEFLKRLTSINEAGILLTDAIAMTAQSKIGILRTEVKRVAQDISWGASTATALSKLEYRIRTDITTRIITLIIKASESTSDVRNVLAIAASDADIEKQLKTARSAEMFVYVFIVYIAFFVFLFIVYVLSAFFLPAIPLSVGDAVAGMPMISGFDLEEYTMLFFHAAVIQGFCSGLIAGQMGSGSLSAGLKHSVIMILITYGVFTLLI